jgi:hypothetical protein
MEVNLKYFFGKTGNWDKGWRSTLSFSIWISVIHVLLSMKGENKSIMCPHTHSVFFLRLLEWAGIIVLTSSLLFDRWENRGSARQWLPKPQSTLNFWPAVLPPCPLWDCGLLEGREGNGQACDMNVFFTASIEVSYFPDVLFLKCKMHGTLSSPLYFGVIFCCH